MSRLIYSENGGVWSGIFAATWPFARIEIYEDRIVVSYLFVRAVFPKESIKHITTLPLLFFVGLKIKHNLKRRRFFIFWAIHRKTILRVLRREGYILK